MDNTRSVIERKIKTKNQNSILKNSKMKIKIQWCMKGSRYYVKNFRLST